jgi:hypothetical protein
MRRRVTSSFTQKLRRALFECAVGSELWISRHEKFDLEIVQDSSTSKFSKQTVPATLVPTNL